MVLILDINVLIIYTISEILHIDIEFCVKKLLMVSCNLYKFSYELIKCQVIHIILIN